MQSTMQAFSLIATGVVLFVSLYGLMTLLIRRPSA